MRGSKRKKRDGVWELRVSIGRDPVTGKYRTISRTVHGSARAADEAMRDLIDHQLPARSDGVGVTFGQLLNRWLEEGERVALSPTTLRTYRAQIERTIRPALGKILLIRLTPKNLDDLYSGMKKQGRSAKTIRNHHAIISAALQQATRWGWVRENVARRAKPPRLEGTMVQAPSIEDVQTIVAAAEERDPRLAPLLVLGALTGMRRGELCALRWPNIDLDGGEITVARSLVIVPAGLEEKSTKSGRVRRLALDDVGITLMKTHREHVLQWAEEAETTIADDAFVFSPFVNAASPFHPDNVTGFFIRVRDSLGLKHVRLHDLRHFTATQLIGANVDIETVANRLGHSDASVTLRNYSHLIEARDRAAAAALGKVFAKPALDQENKSA